MFIVKEAILEKVKVRLQTGLLNVFLRDRAIRVMKDERVPPDCPEEFISIYPGEASTIDPPHNVAKHYNYSFSIGLTRRLNGIPNELIGERLLTYIDERIDRVKPSVFSRANEIVELLEENNGWTLLNEINVDITPAAFLIPFGFISLDAVAQEVNEDHFDVDPSNQNPPRYVGLFMPLTFGGAEFFRPT